MPLFNLVELQKLPEILSEGGVPSDLPRWASLEERRDHRRARVEATAFAGMSTSELSLHFRRLGSEARDSWNRAQSTIGRIVNLLITPKPGYAKIHGGVLIQVLQSTGISTNNEITPSKEFYVRADIALAIAEHFLSGGPDA